MANVDPNLVQIPDQWRITVAKILRSGERQQIRSTVQSKLDWEAAFPADEDGWDYVRFGAIASALEAPILGRKITTMKEPGEVFAFWFSHRNRQIYGKINLQPNGKIIVIYSSHVPRKGDELL